MSKKNLKKLSNKYLEYDSDYKFTISNLDNFDGPLDLILALVKDKKINILDINLLEIATQYIEIINQLKENEIDIAGDYLVMAATLLQLKAKMLLQEPEELEEIEEEKQELIQQLVEYQQFIDVRDTLKTFETKRQDIFIKKPSNVEEFMVDDSSTRLDGHSNPMKLITTLRMMFERVYAKKLRTTSLKPFKLTPEDQFDFIKNLVLTNDKVSFEQVFNVPSIQHFVVTLIAILDLARQQFLTINQDSEFGEIWLTKKEVVDEK
ncbi:segregation/condensation protein A [Mycoplasma sp. NEAQ87857]|uniref:segregation/condensation protein A n=1 Tax=Mycoplasma sp. NEAQ87857 TaxID=2683967 RepID=UPI00131959FC|nr:segregation/condensation protein A [Mycoplasma sp. NEAQ87857]QGZ97304.1 segregation/condensation protein A [Mycoplasma sp. NEAQ87857]